MIEGLKKRWSRCTKWAGQCADYCKAQKYHKKNERSRDIQGKEIYYKALHLSTTSVYVLSASCEVCGHFVSKTLPSYTHSHTYVRTYIHTYIYVYIYIYIYIYILVVYTKIVIMIYISYVHQSIR